MPCLYMEPDYNFDFAFIFASWTQERFENCFNLVCNFGTVDWNNNIFFHKGGKKGSNLNGQT